MKTFGKIILSTLFVLIFSMGAKAQCFSGCSNINGKLQDIHVLGSQAQGTAQQVYTFATNGNYNQMMDRIFRLEIQLSEISQAGREINPLLVEDRMLYIQLTTLVRGIEGARMDWSSAVSSGDNTQIAAGAARLRDSLDSHRGEAQEIRVALCCVMP